jgi:molecular chaperone HtpG
MGSKRSEIDSSPFLQVFKARRLEVLYCYEPVDKFVLSNLRAFDGKSIVSAAHARLTLSSPAETDAGLGASDTAELYGMASFDARRTRRRRQR